MHVLKLLRAGLHQEEIPQPSSTTDPASVNNAADYAGMCSADGETLLLSAQNGRLLLKYGGRDVAFEGRGDDSFYVGHPDLEPFLLEFGRDGDRVVEAFHGPDWYTGHGYRWIKSYLLSREEEKEEMHKCIEAIANTVGQRPLGWFANRAGPNTQELVVEEGGFVYDSNAMNDDLPYFKDVLGKRLLVVPYSRDVNDGGFHQGSGFILARDFFEYMKTAFDRLYEDAQISPRMMSVGLHSRITGFPARASAIDDFIRYAKGFPGVWITRRIDIARWWLENAG